MFAHSGSRPTNLIEEAIPLDVVDLAIRESVEKQGDRHVVCIILDPFFERIAFVYNLSYPAGKMESWGLIGGRSESIGDFNAFVRDKIDPSIRKDYIAAFSGSSNKHVEPPEATAIREAFEEGRLRIRILRRIHEGVLVKRPPQEHYGRVVFLCVAVNRGIENTRALSEPDGTGTCFPQTREFRWFPLNQLPDPKTLGENVYFTHLNTPNDFRVKHAIEEALRDFGELLADLRYVWKNYPAA